jgi:hypothetical protein
MKHFIISICFVFLLIGCIKKSNQSDDFERRIRLVGEVVLDEQIKSLTIITITNYHPFDYIMNIGKQKHFTPPISRIILAGQ